VTDIIADYETINLVTAPQRAPQMLTLNNFLGAIAYNAVVQSPYDCGPDNLHVVLGKFAESAKKDMKQLAGMFCVTLPTQGVYDFLEKHLSPIPEFGRWSLTKHELDLGFTDPNAEDRPVLYVLVSAVSGPKPDYDFIDLYALRRNVVMMMFGLSADAED